MHGQVIGAFIAGMVFATAAGRSLHAYRQYRSSGHWWDAEGMALWVAAAIAIYLVFYQF